MIQDTESEGDKVIDLSHTDFKRVAFLRWKKISSEGKRSWATFLTYSRGPAKSRTQYFWATSAILPRALYTPASADSSQLRPRPGQSPDLRLTCLGCPHPSLPHGSFVLFKTLSLSQGTFPSQVFLTSRTQPTTAIAVPFHASLFPLGNRSCRHLAHSMRQLLFCAVYCPTPEPAPTTNTDLVPCPSVPASLSVSLCFFLHR